MADKEKKEIYVYGIELFDFKSDRYCTGSGTKYRTWKSMEWSGVSCGILYWCASIQAAIMQIHMCGVIWHFLLTYLLSVGIWTFLQTARCKSSCLADTAWGIYCHGSHCAG